MNFKKKVSILSILIILIVQISLLINNKQSTTFRYFIWNVQNVSIGRLVCISFISGIFMSSILNKTLNINSRSKSIIDEENKTIEENDYSVNREDNDEPNEITPERNLRDPQPTISVNYRVIKNNREKDLINRKQTQDNLQHDDDWNDSNYEW